jgi:hypothetical protein
MYMGVRLVKWSVMYMGVRVVKWSVLYMGVSLVNWSVMYMGVRLVKWSVMYMGVRLVKWSVMYMGLRACWLSNFSDICRTFLGHFGRNMSELRVWSLIHLECTADPSKCVNDQTLRSDREFCRTSHRQMSDQIVRPNLPRSEWESPLSDSSTVYRKRPQILLTNKFVHKETCVS